MKKLSLILAILLLTVNFLFADSAFSSYPEIWGYELEWNNKNSLWDRDIIGSSLYDMKNGEIGISVFRNKKTYKEEILSFFTGKILDKKDVKKVIKYFGTQDFQLKNKIVSRDSTGNGSFLDDFYVVKDKKTGESRKFKIFYLLEKPMIIDSGFDSNCEYNFNLKGNKLKVRVVNVKSNLIKVLDDDTFILCEEDGNIVLRLDENFNSKSNLINKKIFIIAQEKFEKIENELNKKNKLSDQTINDAVYDYLIEIRGANGKN